jgi:hypothetical protein
VTEEVEEPATVEDYDPDIPDDEILYRRLSFDGGDWVLRGPAGERIRPVSGGFDPDTDGVSVFRRDVLLKLDPPLGPADVALRPNDIVVGFTVADVRQLQLGVKNDPWPKDVSDSNHPRYAAHALITGLEGLGKSARIKRQRKLAAVSSMTFVNG